MAFDVTTLRAALAASHKTIEEFAHDLGVSTSTVSRWLNGHAKPHKLTQHAINLLLYDYSNRKDSAA